MKLIPSKNKKGHRVHSLWIAVSIDAEGNEGMCMIFGPGEMPLLTTDPDLLPTFQMVVRERLMPNVPQGYRVEIREFSVKGLK